MKTIKSILVIVLIPFLVGCGSTLKTQKAEKFKFDNYKGKTVSTIQYQKSEKGNIININFTDGNNLRVYSEGDLKILK
jgi:hypothetical protein